jgi:cellulose biosynthesis protein BcsQ
MLAALGYKVVFMESDGQGSLSKLVGIAPNNGFYELIAKDAEFADVLRPVPAKFGHGDMSIVSSGDANMHLSNWEQTSTRIYERVQELRDWCDFVIVDTSPAIDEINNAWFYVGDWLIFPTLCERLSVDHLRDKTLAYVESAQRQGFEKGFAVAGVLGILPNRYEARTGVDQVNLGFLEGRYGDRYRIFPAIANAAIWKTSAQLTISVPALRAFQAQGENTTAIRSQAKKATKQLVPVIDEILAKVTQ